MDISRLSSSAREAIMAFVVDQNITTTADGIFSREVLCNDTGNGNGSLAASVGEELCGSQCPSEFHQHCIILAIQCHA